MNIFDPSQYFTTWGDVIKGKKIQEYSFVFSWRKQLHCICNLIAATAIQL